MNGGTIRFDQTEADMLACEVTDAALETAAVRRRHAIFLHGY
jgi:hypothetical protein